MDSNRQHQLLEQYKDLTETLVLAKNGQDKMLINALECRLAEVSREIKKLLGY